MTVPRGRKALGGCAVDLGPKGQRWHLRLSGPDLDGAGWFTVLKPRVGVRGMTTGDNPVYGAALKATGLDQQPCAVPRQRTVGRHIRGLDEDDLAHRDRVLLLIRQRLSLGTTAGSGTRAARTLGGGDAGPGAPETGGAEMAVAPRGTVIRTDAQPTGSNRARLHQLV